MPLPDPTTASQALNTVQAMTLDSQATEMMGLVTICVFATGLVLLAGTFFLVLNFLLMVDQEETPVRKRLNALRNSEKLSLDQYLITQFFRLRVLFLARLEPVARSLYGKNASYLDQIGMLLAQAGLPDNDSAIYRFLAVRLAIGILLGGFFFVFTLLSGSQPLFAIMGLIIGLLLGAKLPEIRLKLMASDRRQEIQYTLPDTLDLMVVCVEAGLSLDATIQRVAEEAKKIAPEFSKELRRVNRDISSGIPRSEVFHHLGRRNGVDELRALCAMIIQSDKLGTSIADTLRVYSQDIRVRRRQKAEELAAKASIKMSFPLVLFVFPPLLIVLIGPIGIQTFRTFAGG
jgi:tight adherence protein C